MINTKTASRRELSFHCTGCLKEELARVEEAERAGSLAHTGNWSPGEVLDHVARVWEYALDGFPPDARTDFLNRILARLIKPMMTSGKTLPAGLNYGSAASYMAPRAGCTVEQGLARLRRVLERLDHGERMSRASPVFGAMTHDEWMRLQLGHAQLHLGFISY